MYSLKISQATTLPIFGEIKRKIKLCNDDAANSRHQNGYNTTYKFDLPYKDFVSNTKSISVKTDNNQMIDKSSWTRCGYGEAGSEICGRLFQKKNFEKCGQTVLCMYAGRFRIHVYMH